MMKNLIVFFVLLFVFFKANAQAVLPNIAVKNTSNKIIVSWKNDYKQTIANISIQRSFDSTKNFTTIGTVLNPQSTENGFADNKPPYNRMYYRLFIAYEGGTYVFSESARAEKIKYNPIEVVNTYAIDTIKRADTINNTFIYPSQEIKQFKDSAGFKILITKPKVDLTKIQPKSNLPEIKTPKLPTYPSNRIFTSKNNAVVIDLPESDTKKYTIKFYTENDDFLFELTKITSKVLIIEKVNFERSGWYNFEIYENGTIIEKNKFFVPKDSKKQQKP